MTPREKLLILVYNQPLVTADAIVLLEGDGFSRVQEAVQLYQAKWAKKIIVSGGIDRPENGCYPAAELARELKRHNIPAKNIILEAASLHTRGQALAVLTLARERGFKKLILVASHYHQYRAFLTFLQATREMKYAVLLVNAPASNVSWTESTPWGKRIDLLRSEFKKIDDYRKKGHIASIAEGIKHLTSL